MTVVLVDIVGPLASHDQAIADRFGHYFPHGTDPAHPTARYSVDLLEHPIHRAHIRDAIAQPGWFEALPAVPGAVDGVHRLAEAIGSENVWFVGKPLPDSPTCRDDKARWLRRHVGEWAERQTILSANKAMIRGDILLDDAPRRAWFPTATWVAVVYPRPFNGPHSEWARLPRWDWTQRPALLLDCIADAATQYRSANCGGS